MGRRKTATTFRTHSSSKRIPVTKLAVIFGFLIAFAAGLTVGMATRTAGLASPAAPTSPATRPAGRGGPGFLIAALSLTPQQADKLREIWSKPPGPHDFDERRGQLRRERDEAVLALVPAADRSRYDEVQKNYKEQADAIEHEMRAGFEDKVTKTKEILTPEQQAKYEEILKQHCGARGGRGSGGPGGPFRPDQRPDQGRKGDDRATTRPAASTPGATQP